MPRKKASEEEKAGGDEAEQVVPQEDASKATDATVLQTVVIPASGDTTRLQWALEGLLAQVGAPGVWELFIVPDVDDEAALEKVQDLWEVYGPKLEAAAVVCWLSFGNSEYNPIKPEPGFNRRASARNQGIASAAGRQVIFLDEDCVPDPDWLAAHWKAFEEGVFGIGLRRHFPIFSVREFPGELYYPALISVARACDREWAGSYGPRQWWTCSASAPLECLKAVGGFSASFDGAWGHEDIDLAERMAEAFPDKLFARLQGGMVTHLDHLPRKEARRDVPAPAEPDEAEPDLAA